MIRPYLQYRPVIDPSCFVADDADVIGQAQLGADSSVFFKTVIRADINTIIIGSGSNIQDQCTVHVASDRGVLIGNQVSIGHQCIIHACELKDNILVGMGSILMDGVVVGRDCIIGAGSLLVKEKSFPEGHLILGNPAKVIRPLTEAEILSIGNLARKYIGVKNNYLLPNV